MQSVTSFAEEDYDPDLIFWDEKDSGDDVEIEDEEMVDRGDWGKITYMLKKNKAQSWKKLKKKIKWV